MNRQAMMDLADRVAHAPDNDARAREIVNLAPDAMLARVGLMHRPSMLGTALAFTGAIAIGAVVGAGVALLLTPITGKELQDELADRTRRLTGKAKDAADRVEARADDIARGDNADRHGAHA